MSEDKEEPKSGAEAYVSRTAALEARIEELEEEENEEVVRFEDERDEWIAHARALRVKLEQANDLIKDANEACDLMGGATNNMEQVEIPDEPD